jgi:hypothetical protein
MLGAVSVHEDCESVENTEIQEDQNVDMIVEIIAVRSE